MKRPVQRLLAVGILLVLGILSLPVSAALLDDKVDENWLIPIAVVTMAVCGAVVGWLLPALGGTSGSRPRGALIGAFVGVAAYAIAFAVWLFMLAG